MVLETLRAESARLLPALNVGIIPPEGVSFGFAVRGARDPDGVAATRITTKSGSPPAVASSGAFGTDDPVVRTLLTVLKFDPEIRCASILAFSDRILSILRDDLFLECRSTPPSRNPGISSMDWGIAACCRDGVPDLVVVRGSTAQDSRIVLFGEDPAAVSSNIIICSNRI